MAFVGSGEEKISIGKIDRRTVATRPVLYNDGFGDPHLTVPYISVPPKTNNYSVDVVHVVCT